MKTMKAIVVDDEEVARTYLADILRCQPAVELACALSNGEAVIAKLLTEPVDLLFADIAMPGMSGLTLVKRLLELTNPPSVIFTTAHGEHALTAFELGAVDYLVKPFGEKRVMRTLERVRSQKPSETTTTSLDRAQATLSQKGQNLERFYVRGPFGIRQIFVDDVSHFSGEDDYVMAHVAGTGHLISVRLNVLEQRLMENKFVRVHRSHIVNLAHVYKFKNLPSGAMEVHLSDGYIVPVSRRFSGVIRKTSC